VTTSPAHPDVVEAAAQGYLEQLRAVAAEAHPDGRLGSAVAHLIETLETALSRRNELNAADVAFSRIDLSNMPEWQLLAVLDQHVLGFGRDDAPLICMGTEEGYDAADGGELALACAQSVLWLCSSKPEVLDRIDPTVLPSARSARPREYHIHPNDFYRWDRSQGRGTSPMIARLLRAQDPESLLVPPLQGDAALSLGDICYQVEVSAYPSKVALGGREPNAVRAKFLADLVAKFDSASALIFHGGSLDDARTKIASSFLGRQVRWTSNPGKREWFAWDAENGRVVMHTYALNGRVRYSYLDLVRDKLWELAPSAFPATAAPK
jgi:hypothetical protein